MRKSRAVVGFWLMHCLGRRDMMEEPLARPVRARGARRAGAADRRHLPLVRGPPGARGPAGPSHHRQAAAGPLPLASRTAHDDLQRTRALRIDPRGPRPPGLRSPTPIQEQAIPPLLEGRDVIGQAQTGTGKTAAFGLPMVEYVDPSDPSVQALVLTPTRELCIQVTQALRAYGAAKGLNVVAIFGGAPIRDQAARLKERAGRRRHGRPRDGHDRPPPPVPRRRALRDPRRGRRDARPRLPRGRRVDPPARADGPPDGALQRHGAARDPPPRRHVHARPGGDQGARGDAHDRHGRPLLRRGAGPREAGRARARAEGGAPRAGDRLRAHQDRRGPAGAPARRRRRAREGAARRHVPGPARRRDDRVQGRARAPADRDRRRGARARHHGR